MSIITDSKINRLLKSWPHGAVYTCSWLYEQGYSYELIDKYRRSDWVFSVGRGAVARSGDKIDWKGGLFAIQKQTSLDVHVGGVSALALSGHAHFLPLGQETIHLYGPPNSKLPTWFRNYHWKVKIRYFTNNLFPTHPSLGIEDVNVGSFDLKISSRERAILEVLLRVSERHSFDHAKTIVQGLHTLRPTLLQDLLEACHSIKVVRLLLYFGEKFDHPWFHRLDLQRFNLGSGFREIVKGGKLDKKYLITVWEDDVHG